MSKQPYSHVVSAGFVLRSGNKFLLGLPSGRSGTTGGWGIPKGKKDDGEKVLTAALREFWEETSLSLENQELEGNINYEREPFFVYEVETKDGGKKVLKTVYVYRARVVDSKAENWLPEFPFRCLTMLSNGQPEISEYKWATAEEAVELVVKSQKSLFQLINTYVKLEYDEELKAKES